MPYPADWITPDWPAPGNVRALITSRNGGVSRGPYATLNLGGHVGDDPVAVAQNRAALRGFLPSEPKWLNQIHGTAVIDADVMTGTPAADGSLARIPNTVCVVMVADCLPVLLCDRAGTVVAAAHAGWRGLCAGVLENTVRAMAAPPAELLAYLGPAIGPQAFEVGGEVRQAFMHHSSGAEAAFAPHGTGKWLADLYLLARQRLTEAGVSRIYGAGYCTYGDAARFFSYRRNGATGRIAALIWLGESAKYP